MMSRARGRPIDGRAVNGGNVDENTLNALHRSQVIDLTTKGCRSGQRRKIEIFLRDKDGQLFISGVAGEISGGVSANTRFFPDQCGYGQ
jgi:hypothetical protein